MIDHGESALPPFPFGALPDLPDGGEAVGAFPSWLALTGGIPDGPDRDEPSPPSLPASRPRSGPTSRGDSRGSARPRGPLRRRATPERGSSCFRAPVAPSVAAQIERKKIDPERILRSFRTLSQRHRFMIIEGAGGIMVPLAQGYLFLDLAEAMGLPVVLVARPGLGTINHTLLTIEALRSRGLTITGVVINDNQGGRKGLAEATSPAVIRALSGVPIIGIIRYRHRSFDGLVKYLKAQ